jgi:hypothetical protein
MEQGWPLPVLADSGNGGHLLYRIDLSNDESSRDVLARCLAALALRFSDEAVSVDETVFNAARIWKLYGTRTCKGDPTPERPHRRAGLCEAPTRLEVVPRDLLENLAALAPAQPDPRGRTSGARLDVEAWLMKNGLPVVQRGTWNGGRKWILNPCPWNSDHTNRATFIVQFPDGAIAAGCHHNSCHGKGWHSLRDLVEPGWRTTREKKPRGGKPREEKPKLPPPPELVGRRLHPALHFDADGLVSVGIVTIGPEGKEITEIITSTRKCYPTEAIGAALAGRPFAYPDLMNRWQPEDVTRFLAHQDALPTFESAVARTWDRLDSLLEMGRDCETVALATWAVATYFHPAFLAFPRMDLRGERGSGKSKALSILAAVSFNGLLRVSPTPAVLFRLAEPLRPTFCLDEIEGLAGDEKREILAILNAGYKAGGRVDRCEGDNHTVKSYSIYGPVALAGITGLNRVTEDRAITIVMARGKDPARLNAEVDPADARFAEIRDLCYRLAILCWQEVAETSRTLPFPSWLVGRERELWRPLLTVAHLADREAGDLNLVSDLLTLAREQGEERAGLSDEAEAVVSVLTEKMGGAAEIIVSPGDLAEDLKDALRLKDAPTPQRVGNLLRRLGFPSTTRATGGRKQRLVTASALEDLRRRYSETYPRGEGESVH